MIVRRLNPSDINQLRGIHERFFKEEFDFNDLFGNSLSSLVVTNGDDKIICGGQVVMITEARIVTDKDIKIEERRRALMMILNHFKHSIASKGFDQLHAFVQDEKWIHHLKRYGFKETKGQALVVSI